MPDSSTDNAFLKAHAEASMLSDIRTYFQKYPEALASNPPLAKKLQMQPPDTEAFPERPSSPQEADSAAQKVEGPGGAGSMAPTTGADIESIPQRAAKAAGAGPLAQTAAGGLGKAIGNTVAVAGLALGKAPATDLGASLMATETAGSAEEGVSAAEGVAGGSAPAPSTSPETAGTPSATEAPIEHPSSTEMAMGAEKPVPAEGEPAPKPPTIADDLQVEHNMPSLAQHAAATPMDREQFNALQLATRQADGHPMLAEPINMVDALRIKQYTGARIGELKNLAVLAKSNPDMPESQAAFAAKVAEIRDEVLPRWAGMRHQIGLALRVLGKPDAEMGPMIKQTAAFMDQMSDSAPESQLMNFLTDLPVEKQTAMLNKVGYKGFWDHFASMYQAMKLTPNTSMKKLTSDFMVNAYAPMERYEAAGYSALRRGLGLGSAEGVSVEEANTYLSTMLDTVGDAHRIGLESLKQDKALFNGTLGFGEAAHRPLGSQGTPLEGTVVGHAYDWLGAAVHNAGGRFILYPDQMSKFLLYQSESRALAMREAITNANALGLQGDEYAAQVASHYSDLINEMPEALHEQATQYSLTNTFAQKLRSDINQGIQRARQGAVGKMILPFYPTPVNIESRAMQQVAPFTLMSKAWWTEVSAGGARHDLAMARLLNGFLTTGLIAKLVSAGRINGALSDNPELKKMQMSAGYQPNSIQFNVGQHGLVLGNLPEPIGPMIGMVADTVDIMGRLPVDPDDPKTSLMRQRADNLGTALTMAFASQLKNDTFFRTISAITDLVSQGAKDPEKAMESKKNLLSSLVPSSVTDLAHWWDPIHRQAKDEMEALKADIPGLSKTLRPQVDLLGRDVVTPLGTGDLSLNLITTPRMTVQNEGDTKTIVDEFTRLDKEGHSVPIPPVPKSFGGAAPSGTKPDDPKFGTALSDDDRYRFQKLRGTLKSDDEHKDLTAAIHESIMSDYYKALPNDAARAKELGDIVHAYHAWAKEEMMYGTSKESLDLQKRMDERDIKRGELRGEGAASELGAP